MIIIILNYNDYKTTIRLVNSIKEYNSIYKIIIVDNFSTDKSFEYLCNEYSCIEKVDVIQTAKNGGYGYGNNYGISYAIRTYDPQYILISNPDVIFDECIINRLIYTLKNNQNAVIAAPLMKNEYGVIQTKSVWKTPSFYQYLLFSTLFLKKIVKSIYYSKIEFCYDEPWTVGCVAGSLFMIDIKKCGFNELYDENIFLYCEETLLGIKLKDKGLETMIDPKCEFIHMHSISIDKSIPKKNNQVLLTWKSRMYILKKYLHGNTLDMMVAYIIRFINIMENKIYFLLKHKQ